SRPKQSRSAAEFGFGVRECRLPSTSRAADLAFVMQVVDAGTGVLYPRHMFSTLRESIRVVFERDPAARSTWEVLTCYPGLHALQWHKLSHWLWVGRLRWLARFSSNLARWFTGIEIHPG